MAAQAPHCPRPQPFGPINPTSLPSTRNSGVSGAVSTRYSSPFTSIRCNILAPENDPSEAAEKDILPADRVGRFAK
jgi:hypothetical protein